MTFAITGATGYIGAHLIRHLHKQNKPVLALSRQQPDINCAWQAYDLNQSDISLHDDVTCVVHLAMNYELNSADDAQREILATERLLMAAQERDAVFIFLSSQTAAEHAPTPYGKVKWAIEKLVREYEGIIIRPGMVYGGKPAGLFGQLLKLVNTLPAIPQFIPAPRVQPIHVEDLCTAIFAAATQTQRQSVYCIAEEKPISFHNFLGTLKRERLHKLPLLIPFPRFIVKLAALAFPQSPALIRLQSLFALPTMYTHDHLRALHVQPRPLRSGMRASGCNRRHLLLREGWLFYRYLLRKKMCVMSLRTYVRVVETLRDKTAIGLKDWLRHGPSLIAFIELQKIHEKKIRLIEFNWRLQAATSLCEASREGAHRYLRLQKAQGFFIAATICAKALMQEIVIRLVNVLIGRILVFTFFQKRVRHER